MAASRLRILYISDVYFPRINGVSTSIHTFRSELQARVEGWGASDSSTVIGKVSL